MTFMGQDYHECRQTLRYLQRNLSVDLAYLACACRGTSLLRTLVVHDNTVVGPYLVPGGTLERTFQHVIRSGTALRANDPAAPQHAPRRDRLRVFTDPRGILAMPVLGAYGEAVACLALSAPLPRIWSRREVNELSYVCEMLRSMLRDATSHSWHSAILRDSEA